MSICNLSLRSRDVLIWNDCQGLQRFSPENYIFLFTKLYHIDETTFVDWKWEHMLLREVISNTREFYNACLLNTKHSGNQISLGWRLYWWENCEKIAMQQSQKFYLWWNICIFLLLSFELHSQKLTMCSVTSIFLLDSKVTKSFYKLKCMKMKINDEIGFKIT